MAPLPQVARAAERRVIGELFLTMYGAMRHAWVNSDAVGHVGEVLACIIIGHVDGRPVSAHKIALSLGLPRATVQRRLDLLEGLGHIERHATGKTYMLTAHAAGRPMGYLDEVVAAVIAAGKQLAHIGH